MKKWITTLLPESLETKAKVIALSSISADTLVHALLIRAIVSDSGSNPESGPNSPPTVGNSQSSPTAASGSGGGSSTPIQEEGESGTAYGGQLSSVSQQGSLSDLSLFSSPSMPNISLGRPHVPSSSTVRHM